MRLVVADVAYIGRFTTRGEFAPPSLRRLAYCSTPSKKRAYEGRIRPSLIAAMMYSLTYGVCLMLRGANSPLPHCGTTIQLALVEKHTSYEGRIRPSLIAALPSSPRRRPGSLLRGANSPLPHCGGFMRCGLRRERYHHQIPTRGEFAPPSLRRFYAGFVGVAG